MAKRQTNQAVRIGIEPGQCVSESGDHALNQVGVVSSGRQNKRTLCHLSEGC